MNQCGKCKRNVYTPKMAMENLVGGCSQISWLSGTCLANRQSLPMRTVVIVGQQICTQQHRMFRSLGLAKGINTKMNIAGVYLFKGETH